jgi:hypothetical protein
MEDRRRQEAEQEAAARRATEKQILEDADHLIAVWNERQAKRMPMLFSPTIGAAIAAGYWFLRARCPACRTTGDVDLRTRYFRRERRIGAATSSYRGREQEPSMDPESQEDRSTIEDRFAEQYVRRYSTRSSVVVIVGLVVVLGLLYFAFR